MGFFKNKVVELTHWGGQQLKYVWTITKGRFAFIEEMGDKFILSLEEELAYEKIVVKLEEM
jgi:hypothetical protein